MNRWTQDEAIAFEAARECISDMMAICSEALAAEECRSPPNAERIAQCEAELRRLAAEQRDLRVTDFERIAHLRADLAWRRAP